MPAEDIRRALSLSKNDIATSFSLFRLEHFQGGGIQTDEVADALFLHSDAVKHVGKFHRAAAVGDHYELGLVAVFL